MRQTCVNMIFELSKRDTRVFYIGSDLSPDITARMTRDMPDRAFMEGVSEANVVGMAAGLAMEGYIPFVHTIATFITRRCYEQVALDVCLHNLPVRLIGNGGGLVYAPLGPTHLAIEDIAIMRALPNMTVVAVSDADEMRRLMNQTLDWPGPIYIRLAKGGDPIVSRAANGFQIGKAISMRSEAGASVALISTGIMTRHALTAAESLSEQGFKSNVLHVHTIKPLDAEAIRRCAEGVRMLVIVEEHTTVGGLGSAVLDSVIENMGSGAPAVKRMGIPDVFAKSYGTQDDLLETYGLRPAQISSAITEAFRSMNAA